MDAEVSASQSTGRIGIVPYGSKYPAGLATIALDRLNWPLGAPAAAGGTIANLAPQDTIIVYPSTAAFFRSRKFVACKVALLLAEPRSYHQRYYRLARLFPGRFARVLTYDATLNARLANALFVPYGTSWVPEWQTLDLAKSAMISLIASAKKKLPGHQLRHRIAALCTASTLPVAVMGRGYRAFDSKAEGLASYRYSVAIENSREAGYFTEKLLDCFFCLTVPIYWGAPDIDRYFDPRGMIVCTSEAEIMAAIHTVSEEDYAARLPFVEANRAAAMHYLDYELNAAEALRAAGGGVA